MYLSETRSTLEQIHAPVLRPGDPGYDTEVSGFNAAISHTPTMVVRAACDEDVAVAVRHAGHAGLPVAVQATGHGAHRDFGEGLLISTRSMDQVTIDPAARTATVGAGARWRSVLDAGAPHGLGGLCGSTTDVGVVGYTLGGGMPVLGRAFGFAADRLRSATVVTGDGQLRLIDADTDPELFWALRGGGGSLGVVTAMTFDLLPLSHIMGGGLFYDGEHAAAVLETYATWTGDLPNALCTSLAFLRLPPLPEIPEPLRGRFVMHLRVSHPDPTVDLAPLLAPMRACAPVMIDTVAPMPYSHLDAIHQDPAHPVPFAERGALLDSLTTPILDALLEHAGPGSGCPLLLLEVRHLGGALRAGLTDDGAIGARDADFHLLGVGVCAGPTADAVRPALDALHEAIRPHTSGRTFVSLHGVPGDAADRSRAWTGEQYARLCRIKRRVDPAGVFGHEHALVPAAAS